ncbi:MAG: hypothetical protein J6N76_00785, partial [Lachnospiraceae bacterium]|nr:hypothetical protein [Lachnospiraceae bacterium]
GNLYSFANNLGAADPKSYDDMISSAASSPADAAHSYDYDAYRTEGLAYPYRTVVKDNTGARVHYGSWQKRVSLGSFGIFYWECETGSQNNGYHLTYIGVNEDKRITGTTLCTAHDDGGEIVRYGYGYYVKNGNQAHAEGEGLHLPAASSINAEAQAALHIDLPDYTFYPFETLPSGVAVANGDGYLYMTENKPVATMKVYDDTNGNSLEYGIAPYFANAMYEKGVSGIVTDLTLTRNDGFTADYSQEPGTSENAFESRSAAQLQYINWNANTKNTHTLVKLDNRMDYPYLQYATVITQGLQRNDVAGVLSARPVRYWVQSHDINGRNITDYAPIAGMGSSNTQESGYYNYLYGWFGGSYDGQSYKIQNLNIVSDSFSVGLFGVTVGATIKNIIMYGDGTTRVERNTTLPVIAGEPAQVGAGISGSYTLGGLIGLAYDYNLATSTNEIKNCAIAGYQIIDNSTNKQENGGAVIGGLTGVANVRLADCSAVTRIEINSTHEKKAEYGAYIRVGGLTGSALYSVTDCYSGGSINISDYTKNEWPVDSKGVLRQGIARKDAVHIYVAGISASAYGSNFCNFTGRNDGLDNNDIFGNSKKGVDEDVYPVFTNCYTYTSLPNLEGNIRGVTLIAGPADRYMLNTRMTIKNCYYLDSVRAAIKYIPTDRYLQINSSHRSLTEEEFQNILDGDLSVNNAIVHNHGTPSYLATQPQVKGKGISVTYKELSSQEGDMAERLNVATDLSPGNAWGHITATEGSQNAAINGKYSFPVGDPALDGLNYPFPTVITQKDLVFNRTVFVHYGQWPLDGAHWEQARDKMDLFADKEPEDEWAYREFKLLQVPDDVTLDASDIHMSIGGIVEVVSVTNNGASTVTPYTNDWTVKIKALHTGTEELSVATGGNLSNMILEVTANMLINTDPAELVHELGGESEVKLHANSNDQGENNTDYSEKVTWSATAADMDYTTITTVDAKTIKVKSNAPGRTQLIITATLSYNGTEYSYTRYVTLITYGSVGLSNNGLDSGAAFWQEIPRGKTDRAAADKAYAVDDPAAPKLSYDGTADFYLYMTAVDAAMSKLSVTSVTINGVAADSVTDDGSSTDVTVGDYVLSMGSSSKLKGDDNYLYRPMTIRPVAGKPAAAVTVELSVSDEETGAVYTFGGTLEATHILTYNINGGDEFAISSQRIRTGALISDQAPVKKGYKLAEEDSQKNWWN